MAEVAHSDGLEVTEYLLPGTRLTEVMQETLRVLPEMPDSQIIRTAIYAGKLEAQAYLIRGACAAELRKRFTNKLVGGRGKRDEQGAGVQARMTYVAHEVGVDLRTLMADLRIYRTFFEPAPEKIRALACERPLPREFFVTALAAPDPQAAIEMAVTKRRDPAYTRQQYRADVRALKNGSKEGWAERSAKGSHYLRVAVSHEAQQALSELSQATGKEVGFVVEEALLALRRKLLRGGDDNVNRKRLKPGSPAAKRRNTGGDSIQYSLEYSE